MTILYILWQLSIKITAYLLLHDWTTSLNQDTESCGPSDLFIGILWIT